MNIDDDILQDFLVEAGELFEMLGEQIVELEQSPQDSDLLNAIFRAFHTIKGGAGFLKITPMVEVCHRAEDVFNVLREGEQVADAALIDVILQVIDVLGEMFDQLRGGEALTDADPELLRGLEALIAAPQATQSRTNAPEATEPASAGEPATASAEAGSPDGAGGQAEDAAPSMDDEFNAMLEEAQQESGEAQQESQASDLITDEEFEQLLDEIHGEGKHGGVPANASPETADGDESTDADTGAAQSDLITDEEFEAVLDEMYGKGAGPTKKVERAAETASPDSGDSSENHADAAEVVAQENPAAAEKPLDVVKTAPSKKTAAKPKPQQAESSVRVDTARLDDIMNLVGELVLVRNRLSTLKQLAKENQIVDAISSLELVTSDLQASVMKTRMQPIKKVFNRFPRVIRDLARQLDKDINLELIGEDTDLDKNLVEALADPLIHLVRNAVDHGIESPEDRFSKGKPRQGTVVLSAAQEGDQILLTISDDGKGMDHELLRRNAVEKGILSQEAADRLTESEAFELIFAPGFSTKEEISDVSGRGVGMDVVKTRITELNGTLEIDSRLGRGTVITIRLPLTLAILPTLMVNLGKYQFALPLTNVNEAFNMRAEQINIVDGQEVMRVRDKPLPLFYLHSWLVQDSVFDGPKDFHKVIVVQMGSQQFCLVVDHLIGQEEVVIKPLGAMLAETPGFAGATITGDGSIALVLDIPSLIKRYAVGY